MPKKLKVSTIKDDTVSYDDVVNELKSEVAAPAPEVEVEAPTTTPVEEPKEEVNNEVQVDEKPKKTSPMEACPACGKVMTVKNLRYAHKFICPVTNQEATSSDQVTTDETEIEEVAPEKPKLKRSNTKPEPVIQELPPPPKLKRSVRKIETEPEPEPEPKPKAKRNPKTARPSEAVKIPIEPRKSRAVKRAEMYEQLVAQALP